jgi:hypothetical protein
MEPLSLNVLKKYLDFFESKWHLCQGCSAGFKNSSDEEYNKSMEEILEILES